VPRILLLEDDPAIARTVAYALEREGIACTHCMLLGDARSLLARERFDAAVLDVGLPDGNGLDLCREIAATRRLPVLVLSARGEESDRVLGLELGADDYVAKPFSPREFVARVRALLRRGTPPPAAPAAALVDDAAGQRVLLHGAPLALTRREYHLLAALLRQPGRILSRDALLAVAWDGATDSGDRTVDTHVKTLRAKLRGAGAPDCIGTHRGLGYSCTQPAAP
jgi:two-component system catabolic regulation response regulator CreB